LEIDRFWHHDPGWLIEQEPELQRDLLAHWRVLHEPADAPTSTKAPAAAPPPLSADSKIRCATSSAAAFWLGGG
jgi:hypothetical protein